MRLIVSKEGTWVRMIPIDRVLTLDAKIWNHVGEVRVTAWYSDDMKDEFPVKQEYFGAFVTLLTLDDYTIIYLNNGKLEKWTGSFEDKKGDTQ